MRSISRNNSHFLPCFSRVSGNHAKQNNFWLTTSIEHIQAPWNVGRYFYDFFLIQFCCLRCCNSFSELIRLRNLHWYDVSFYCIFTIFWSTSQLKNETSTYKRQFNSIQLCTHLIYAYSTSTEVSGNKTPFVLFQTISSK